MLDHDITDYDEPTPAIMTLAQGFSSIAAGESGTGVKDMVLLGVRLFSGETAVVILRSPDEVDQIVEGIIRVKNEVWGD
jgi:hypothetical protein